MGVFVFAKVLNTRGKIVGPFLLALSHGWDGCCFVSQVFQKKT